MAGAVEVTARGAIEAGERGGDQPQADSAGAQGVEGDRGVVWDHAAFHKAKAVGEVRLRQVYQPPYSPESCEADICGGSAVGRREDLWEHRGEVGGCGEFFEEL